MGRQYIAKRAGKSQRTYGASPVSEGPQSPRPATPPESGRNDSVPSLSELLLTGTRVMPSSSSPFVEDVAGRLELEQTTMAAEILETMRRDIPEYGAIDDPLALAELLVRCRFMIAVFARVLRNEPGILAEAVELGRTVGRARAREGFPLGATVDAFRVGMNVGWERVSRDTGHIQTPEDANAVLAIALQLLHFVGEVSRAITEAYVEAAPSATAPKQGANQGLVGDFLSGGFISDNDLGSRAVRFRYDLRSPHAIVLIAERAAQPTLAAGDGPRPAVNPCVKAGEALIRRVPDALPIAVVATPLPHSAALAPVPDATKWPQLLAICEEVGRNHDVAILVVPPIAGVVAIFDSYADARDSLPLARRVMRGQERVTSIDALRVYRVLEGGPEDRRRFLRSTLGPVLDLTESRRLPLIESLETWFAAAGSIHEAARRLFVHPNTLRYRLRHLEKLTGLSLRNPHHQARLDLALHLMRLEQDTADG